MRKFSTDLERETSVEIYLNPFEDWDANVKEFNEYMYSIDDIYELVQFIARHVSQHGEMFIEGVGSCREVNWDGKIEFKDANDVSVIFNITRDGFNETDVEEMK